jgi:hypothetical protein
MQEVYGDLWSYHGSVPIGISTAGQVSRKGNCVMLRGCGLFSFPVEHGPFEVPDLRLIERSCGELVVLADEQGWQQVVVPRPGCGGGGLEWHQVKPLLERHFDGRFQIITQA